MILKAFKTNSPISALISLGLLILLWVKSFNSGVGSNLLNIGALYHFENELSDLPKILLISLSLIIILITATILNTIINQDEFFDKNTFLPFALYTILMSVLLNFNNFNPIIIGNFFLVLFLRWAFKIRRQDDARQIMFNSSFLLSCATLFFPVYSPLLLSPFVLLVIFRPFIWREWFLSALGLTIPAAFYAYFMYFLNFPFESNSYNHSFWEMLTLQFTPDIKHYIYIILYGVLSLVAFFVVSKKMSSSSLRLRMLMRFLAYNYAIALVISFGLFFISEMFLLVAALPLTLFFSYYFYYTKPFWGNLYFYLLLSGIFFSLYFV